MVPVEDERFGGAEDHLPRVEQVYRLSAEDPATPEELAQALGVKEKTVRNHLAVLRSQGRAKPLEDGRWEVIPNSRCFIGYGNRERARADPDLDPLEGDDDLPF